MTKGGYFHIALFVGTKINIYRYIYIYIYLHFLHLYKTCFPAASLYKKYRPGPTWHALAKKQIQTIWNIWFQWPIQGTVFCSGISEADCCVETEPFNPALALTFSLAVRMLQPYHLNPFPSLSITVWHYTKICHYKKGGPKACLTEEHNRDLQQAMLGFVPQLSTKCGQGTAGTASCSAGGAFALAKLRWSPFLWRRKGPPKNKVTQGPVSISLHTCSPFSNIYKTKSITVH